MTYPLPFPGFPGCSVGNEPACNARRTGDAGPIPGLGRCPGGGHGNSLQYSCLENPVDSGDWRATVHRITKTESTEQKKEKIPLPLFHGKRKLYLQKLKFSKNHMLDGILVLC